MYKKNFHDSGFITGRMISFSKTLYCKTYPNNRVVFNANVLTKEDGKIWHGDLDLTIDAEKLNKIAKEIGKKLYVLKEMDYRFENENEDIAAAIKKATWVSSAPK